jgi:hypothetical protein
LVLRSVIPITSPLTPISLSRLFTSTCLATGGDIVYENSGGTAQWVPGTIEAGIYPIAARRILTSGIVNGTERTTTATGLVYGSTNIP